MWRRHSKLPKDKEGLAAEICSQRTFYDLPFLFTFEKGFGCWELLDPVSFASLPVFDWYLLSGGARLVTNKNFIKLGITFYIPVKDTIFKEVLIKMAGVPICQLDEVLIFVLQEVNKLPPDTYAPVADFPL